MARPKRKVVRYPPLPASLEAAGGTVTIELVDAIRHEGTECWGLYDHARRHVAIDRTATRAHQWRTLFHEMAHVAILDAGLDNGIEDRLHEALCDAWATSRMRERFG